MTIKLSIEEVAIMVLTVDRIGCLYARSRMRLGDGERAVL